VVLVALACVCWGLDNNFTSLIDGLTPAQVTFVKGIVGGAFNLTLGMALETHVHAASPVLWAMLIGAAGYGLSILFYISGAQQLGASRSQMLFAASPFLGTCLSWALLGEAVQPVQIGAGAIMAVGLALMLSESHGHGHYHGAVTHVHYHSHDDGHHDHRHDRIEPGAGHAHEHDHPPVEHSHPHMPDLHHRHNHKTAP
jgi:drug/metabolite transporter (DMT)-like permease